MSSSKSPRKQLATAPVTSRKSTAAAPGVRRLSIDAPDGSGAQVPVDARLSLRRNQRISLGQYPGEHMFLIESGCLIVEAALSNGSRVVMQILYPGDIVSHRTYPALPQVTMTAKTAASIQRSVAGANLMNCGKPDKDAPDALASTMRLLARSNLHAIAIGRLSGEERLATLLVELALELGQETAGGISFELPISRADMADYLALNPDTLSRLISRMRSRGLLAVPTRSRAILKSLDGLSALTPLYAQLRHLYARNQDSGGAWESRK